MSHVLTLNRRLLLGFGLATLPNASRAQDEAGLLVAGPTGAWLDRWADPLCLAVGQALPSHAPLVLSHVGGLDGVTGANAFEARGEPDGFTALLVPGGITLPWLVGETRARFDPARWLVLWAATVPAVLVSRVQLEAGRSLRVAASSPVGPELPVLLALDLLGISAVLSTAAEADAVLVQGSPLPVAIPAAAARGLHPVLSLGVPTADMALSREPLLPSVPTAFELVRDRAPPRMAATLLAASLAVQLEAGLVLPQLTPAASVAAWRRACQPTLHDAELVAEAGRKGARMMSASDAMGYMGRIAGEPDVLLTLRRWLGTQYGWHPA